MSNYVLWNQTPEHLVLEGPDSIVRLAPLQRRTIGRPPAEVLGEAGRTARSDQALDWQEQPSRSWRLVAAGWVAVAAVAVGLACLPVVAASRNALAGGLLALGAVLLMGVAWAVVTVGVDAGPAGEPVDIDPARPRTGLWDLLFDLWVACLHALGFTLLVLVAIGGPTAAIYYGTELSSVVVVRDGGLALVSGADQQYVVVARALQVLLVILMSLVPALMYFQFDREKLTTLLDRWLHAIFRLDPTLQTVSDVDAKYGRRVEEYYGAPLSTCISKQRRRAQARSPVVVATLLIAIGWVVVLVSQTGQQDDPPTFRDIFVPSPTPMGLAFLGAYFLAVQVALRGYVRGDLKPKTYNVITVRILMAVVLAWALQALGGTGVEVLALSFLAGVLPSTVLRKVRDLDPTAPIRAAGRRVLGRPRSDADELGDRSPLSELDDVDVYERTRLEEEGITSVQALARHDLVDLTLSSRIPVPRLVDWVDQALLQQHAGPLTAGLRAAGVRGATDLVLLCDDDERCAELEATVPREAGQPPLRLLRAVLERDEWLSNVSAWRARSETMPRLVVTYDRQGRRRVGTRSPCDPEEQAAVPSPCPAAQARFGLLVLPHPRAARH